MVCRHLVASRWLAVGIEKADEGCRMVRERMIATKKSGSVLEGRCNALAHGGEWEARGGVQVAGGRMETTNEELRGWGG